MKTSSAITVFGIAAVAAAQSTTPDASQVSAFWSDTENYYSSLASNPSIESLYSEITKELPESVQDDIDPTAILTQVFSINSNTAIPTADLVGTPHVPTYSWESYLKSDVRSELQSLATSVALAEQTFIRENLNTGTASSYMSHGVGWIFGVAAGAVGIAAVLL
ncbi:MAG: hypothetical protein M1821_007995 [Bathelium mastoideum]|nr:MAG: hypothetical protein M1821_007995 [Bathelium mastoideum]